jgi:hypothetical protein
MYVLRRDGTLPRGRSPGAPFPSRGPPLRPTMAGVVGGRSSSCVELTIVSVRLTAGVGQWSSSNSSILGRGSTSFQTLSVSSALVVMGARAADSSRRCAGSISNQIKSNVFSRA